MENLMHHMYRFNLSIHILIVVASKLCLNMQVSHTYSKEVARNPAVAPHLYKFHGILNGIDPDIWDPYNDKFIPVSRFLSLALMCACTCTLPQIPTPLFFCHFFFLLMVFFFFFGWKLLVKFPSHSTRMTWSNFTCMANTWCIYSRYHTPQTMLLKAKKLPRKPYNGSLVWKYLISLWSELSLA